MEVPNSTLNMKSTIKYLLFTAIVFIFTSNVFSQGKKWDFQALAHNGLLLGARPNFYTNRCYEDRTFSFNFNVLSKPNIGLALKQLL